MSSTIARVIARAFCEMRLFRCERCATSPRCRAAVALVLGATLAIPQVGLATAEFAPALTTRGGELRLCATALMRYLVVFDGFSAGLYLRDCSARQSALADVPKRLEITYFWSITASQFATAADDLLARSLAEDERAGLRERIDRLHAHYKPVRPGDRYALSYTPGEGTELSLNGEPLVTVAGADFARAYFGIWLGAKPIDESFRDTLLGRDRR